MPTHSPRRSAARAAAVYRRVPHRAFTLTELLVVIGIIVLMLTLSLPAITYLTG